MRPDPCQSSKRKAVEPVRSPSGTVDVTPLMVNFADLPLAACATGRKRNSAATCGRLPAACCRICRPASVGAPFSVKPGANCRSVHRCNDPKNHVLSLPLKYGRRTGPPKVPPNWSSIRKGAPWRTSVVAFGSQKPPGLPALSWLLQALKWLLLLKKKALPWYWFVPLLVMTLNTEPELRPYSAAN